VIVVVTHALLALVAQSDDVPITVDEAATLCTFEPALDRYTCGSDEARARLRFRERTEATDIAGVTIAVRALDDDGCVRAVTVVATSATHDVHVRASDAALFVDGTGIALDARARKHAAGVASAALFARGRDPADTNALCIAPARLHGARASDELVVSVPLVIDDASVVFQWRRTRAWIVVAETDVFRALPEPPRPPPVSTAADRDEWYERALIREGLRRRHDAWTRAKNELPIDL
jgi:hypothetical protein